MGDPRRIRKKYMRPRHPWEQGRIENERELIREYGLSNKQEIWKMDSLLRGFKDQVKKLNAMAGDEQAEKEKEQLMNKLQRLGILEEGKPMDEVLGLDIRSILERRLQSVVYRKGLARSMNQARQFVVHEHVTVDGQKVTVPSYLVKKGQDVEFADNSPFDDEMHPERVEKKPSKTHIEKKEDDDEDEEPEELAYEEDEILDEEEQLEKKAKERKKKAASEEAADEDSEAEEPAEEDSEAGDEEPEESEEEDKE